MIIRLKLPGSDYFEDVEESQRAQYPGWMYMGAAPEELPVPKPVRKKAARRKSQEQE